MQAAKMQYESFRSNEMRKSIVSALEHHQAAVNEMSDTFLKDETAVEQPTTQQQLRIDAYDYDDLTFVYAGSLLWDDFDELEEMVDQASTFQHLAVGSAFGMTTGLTAGYVLWIVRGGYLLSSLIAQMPAWTFVDPLPVLEFLNEEEEDGEEDSVEGMLEKSERESRQQQREDSERATDDQQPPATRSDR